MITDLKPKYIKVKDVFDCKFIKENKCIFDFGKFICTDLELLKMKNLDPDLLLSIKKPKTHRESYVITPMPFTRTLEKISKERLKGVFYNQCCFLENIPLRFSQSSMSLLYLLLDIHEKDGQYYAKINESFYALKRANTYYPRHIKIFPYELGFNFHSGFHRLHRLQEQVQDFSFGLEKFISLFYEIEE